MIRIAITILYPSSSMVFLYLKECTELTGVGTVSVKVFHNVGKCEMKPTVGRGNLFSFLVFDSFFFFLVTQSRKIEKSVLRIVYLVSSLVAVRTAE